ncbi:hypothetical protein Ddc_06974 [Ditylenchus destructor]|nr:hypothetical protein Ddc_06974 [Ditylenchus destructor]
MQIQACLIIPPHIDLVSSSVPCSSTNSIYYAGIASKTTHMHYIAILPVRREGNALRYPSPLSILARGVRIDNSAVMDTSVEIGIDGLIALFGPLGGRETCANKQGLFW